MITWQYPTIKREKCGTAYGVRASYMATGWHIANDLKVGGNGKPIKPISYGRVIKTGIWEGYERGYGNYVTILHYNSNGRKITSKYAHAQKNLVKVNDIVKPDTVIQLSDSTGYSTGSHLHLEIRDSDSTNREHGLDLWQIVDKPLGFIPIGYEQGFTWLSQSTYPIFKNGKQYQSCKFRSSFTNFGVAVFIDKNDSKSIGENICSKQYAEILKLGDGNYEALIEIFDNQPRTLENGEYHIHLAPYDLTTLDFYASLWWFPITLYT